MNCKLCKNLFDSIELRPAILVPCGHTYCFQCLDKLNQSKCPGCHQTIQQRRTNLFILELIETDSLIKQTLNQYLLEIEDSIRLFQENYANKKQMIKKEIDSIAENRSKPIAKYIRVQLKKLKNEVIKFKLEIECHRILLDDDMLNQIQLVQLKEDLILIKSEMKLKLQQLGRINFELEVKIYEENFETHQENNFSRSQREIFLTTSSIWKRSYVNNTFFVFIFSVLAHIHNTHVLSCTTLVGTSHKSESHKTKFQN